MRRKPLPVALAPAPPLVYLTTAEAAEYLRTTRGTIYNLVWRGELPRRRGKLLFTIEELDNYLAHRSAPAPVSGKKRKPKNAIPRN